MTIHSTSTKVLLNSCSWAWDQPLQKAVPVQIPAFALVTLYLPKSIKRSYTPTANDVHLKAVDTFAFQLTYL